MELKDILSISGQPGLYKYISQSKNGMIVESLENQKRMNAYTTQKISSLDDIAIFTNAKEIPLSEVFKKIFEKENGEPCIDPKSSPDDLKKYFAQLLPEYDRERVYPSDIKKVATWYNLLLKYQLMGPELWEKKEESVADVKPEAGDKHTASTKAPKIPGQKKLVKKVKEPAKKQAAPSGMVGAKLKNVGVKKSG